MTQSELDILIEKDYYHILRKNPSEAEIRLFLREVGYHCPLCGKELHSRKQSKPGHKQFQIAHIYPNRPTIQQYIVLHELERLGKTSEDFENKIALCHLCHSRQDYYTTKDDYEALLSIKKKCLEQNALHDAVDEMYLESELNFIVEQICKISFSELAALNMNPVRVADKFEDGDALILSKITGYVTQYYTFIRDLFRTVRCSMRFPDKITSYKESVFRLIPLILNQISECDMRPVEIYELIKSCTLPSEYIEALDCLFILKKIEFNQQSGELHYVA